AAREQAALGLLVNGAEPRRTAPESDEQPLDPAGPAAGRAEPRKRHGYSVCLLSLSNIADDPRIRRQGDALHDAGWRVTAVGMPGGRSPPPAWPILVPDLGPEPVAGAADISAVIGASGLLRKPPQGPVEKLDLFMRRTLEPYPALYRLTGMLVRFALRLGALKLIRLITAMRRAALAMPGVIEAGVAGIRAAVRQGSMASIRHLLQLIPLLSRRYTAERHVAQPPFQNLLAVASRVEADLYLANDWPTLPIAMSLAAERRRFFAYDTHEYALEEFLYKPDWRRTMGPTIKAIESRGLAGALVASTVSGGIARDMAKAYRLSKPLLVVRNVPEYSPETYRPCGSQIAILFHGLLVPDRGLEACVESVALWRQEFSFAMRGPIQPAFRQELDEIIDRCGVRGRVNFLPPVAMVDLVREAWNFDIGIFTPPKSS